jgi:putative ABC transport system permease protein
MLDLKFALRQLLKAPGFAAVAILTLALAIGVNSAIFSLINNVILRPMVPLRPEEVVNVFNCRQNANHDYRPFSFTEFRELKKNTEVFADVAALEFAVAGIGQDREVQRSFAFLTSENYFTLMGVTPFRGRFYNAEEARPNANIPVVVTSYEFWKRHGGRSDLVGSSLRINGQPYTVIGITPKGFGGASALIAPDIWLPFGIHGQLASALADSASTHDLENPKSYALNLVARMQRGITLANVKSRLPALSQRFNAVQGDGAEFAREVQLKEPSRFDLSTSPEDDGPITLIGTLLMAMAGAVLLIASLNLANMLLARGTARSKEIALRLAVGASRWRIIRQLLCEGLLLAIAGGLLGLVLSAWCNSLLLRSFAALLSNVNFSFILDLKPDVPVLLVTFVFCLLATLLFSLGPALKASRADLVNDLKQQIGEPARIGRVSRFFAPRHISVMVQIALSLMLLFASGLFLRGAIKAANLDPGFVAAGDLVTEIDYSLVKKDPKEAQRLIFRIVEQTRQLPGVRSVGAGTMLPYGNFGNSRRIMSARATLSNDPKAPDPGATGMFTATTPGYFDAIGVKILRGRDFTQAECEDKDGRRIAIIDQSMAKKIFPNEEALGQHIRYTIPPRDGSPNDMEIVGIVGVHRHDVQNDTPTTRLFVPFAQAYSGNVYLHTRLQTADRQAVAGMIPGMRAMLRSIDPELPILSMAPWEDLMGRSVGLWIVKLGAMLFGAFGGIALLLAVVGVYGVKAYAVACRTREIGIRMALGARRQDVFALIMRQGAMQTMLAVTVGILLSLGVGRILAQILYQVSPADPYALVTSSVLLAVAALLACFLPARRATNVNPIKALRTE